MTIYLTSLDSFALLSHDQKREHSKESEVTQSVPWLQQTLLPFEKEG